MALKGPLRKLRAAVRYLMMAYDQGMANMVTPRRVRLHLGCGSHYLPGYVNIDLPPKSRATVERIRVDIAADLRELQFLPGSIAEIRTHHVLEHFDRPASLRLLTDWYTWLREGGVFRVETPDLEGCIRRILDPSVSMATKMLILRHIFGSHEAFWAYHLDGWYREKFEYVLTRLGFTDLRYAYSEHHNLDSITVWARKRRPFKAAVELREACEGILKLGLVDEEVERSMYETWISKLSLA